MKTSTKFDFELILRIFELYTKLEEVWWIMLFVMYAISRVKMFSIFFYSCLYKPHMLLTNTITFYLCFVKRKTCFLPSFSSLILLIYSYISRINKITYSCQTFSFLFFFFPSKESESNITNYMAESPNYCIRILSEYN